MFNLKVKKELLLPESAFLFNASCYTAIVAVQCNLFDTLLQYFAQCIAFTLGNGYVEGETGANSFQYVAILSNTLQDIQQSCVMITMEQSFSHRCFFVVIKISVIRIILPLTSSTFLQHLLTVEEESMEGKSC